jgi:hypothetical protein
VRFSFYRAETKGTDWTNKVTTMRTIERIVAEKLGEKEAVEFFVLVSKGTFLEDIWEKKNMGKEMLECLKKNGLVDSKVTEEIQIGQVKQYLVEMVGGRFAFVERANE